VHIANGEGFFAVSFCGGIARIPCRLSEFWFGVDSKATIPIGFANPVDTK